MSAPESGPEPTAAAPAGPQPWLEVALDLLPFPLFLIEPGSAAVRFANRAARRLPLDPPSEHNGSPSAPHLLGPEGDPVPAGRLPHRRAARGERIEGEQVTWNTPHGAISYLVFAGPVPALHGQPPLAVLTLVDVTRLKATEAELRRTVQDRDEFFSVATHELKDSLASLQLSLSLLQFLANKHGSIPAERLREQLEVGRRQTDRLNRLIENLLDVARIANKRLQLDVEAFDLCELAAEAVARFEVPAGGHPGADLLR